MAAPTPDKDLTGGTSVLGDGQPAAGREDRDLPAEGMGEDAGDIGGDDDLDEVDADDDDQLGLDTAGDADVDDDDDDDLDDDGDESDLARPAAAADAGNGLASSFYAIRDQAVDHARSYVDNGKGTIGDTIGGYAETVRQAAQQIEDAAGPQIATYAHQAADFLEEAAETIRTKDVEELMGEARDLMRRSPALALGAAAAIGFALSRFLKSTAQQLEPVQLEARAARRPAESASAAAEA